MRLPLVTVLLLAVLLTWNGFLVAAPQLISPRGPSSLTVELMGQLGVSTLAVAVAGDYAYVAVGPWLAVQAVDGEGLYGVCVRVSQLAPELSFTH